MLEIQKLFKLHGFKEGLVLLEGLDISVVLEKGIDDKQYMTFNYGIKSPSGNAIVNECRGLSLNDSFDVVRMGFNRFYNYNDSACGGIDFSLPLTVEDKLDGSLIFLTYLEGCGWMAGTRSRMFPVDNIVGTDFTFGDLFWRVFDCVKAVLDVNYMYVFELCSRFNRIVIDYEDPTIYLLGMRRREILLDNDSDVIHNSLEEVGSVLLNVWADRLGVSRPECKEFSSVESIIEYLSDYHRDTDNDVKEGFVVRQGVNRMKIKSLSYVALHNIHSSRSLNNLVKLVLQGSRKCLENGFSEYLGSYDKISSAFSYWINGAEDCLKDNIGLGIDRKVFAQSVCKTPFASYCFARLDGRVGCAKEFLVRDMNNSKIKRLIRELDLASLVGSGWKLIDDCEKDI